MNRSEGFHLIDESDVRGMIGASATELQAPLVLIRQLSLALEDDALALEERQRLVERLTLTTERALRLAKGLQSSHMAPELLKLEPVNAAMICKEVVYELTPLFRAHGRVLTVQPRSKSLLMVADRSLLRQVLLGFIDNALSYGSEEQPVRLIIGGHADRVRLGVRDYGPAVNKDIWSELERRAREKSPTLIARRPRASGVNLVMAKQLTELMGGVAGVMRHRDGATFYVDMKVSGQMSLL